MPLDEKRLSGALNELSPSSQRDNMAGATIASQQPGAVRGVGGYVYQPQDGGAIKILHDPTGKANGAVLSEGPAFTAIQKELGLDGPTMTVDFDPVHVTAKPLESDSTETRYSAKDRRDITALEQDAVESTDDRTPQQKYDDGDTRKPSDDIAALPASMMKLINKIVEERIAAALKAGKERQTTYKE